MSLGCCDGGGPFGKRPEFMAGENVGEAREPVQALRLRKEFTSRSVENGGGVKDERRALAKDVPRA